MRYIKAKLRLFIVSLCIVTPMRFLVSETVRAVSFF
jgi:hypothetical protein